MKKGVWGAVGLMFICSQGFAQSSLNLYGVVDMALRHETNGVDYAANGRPTATGRKISIANGGGLTESYWGLSGTENIGNGNQISFRLESRFNPGSGNTLPAGSKNFFQLSWVAFQSPTLGRLSLGRQYNAAFLGTTLAYGSNMWAAGEGAIGQDPYTNLFKPEQTLLGGARTSNLIQYGAKIEDLIVLAQYAPGGRPGGGGAGSQMGASIAYVPTKGAMKIGASFVRTRDDLNNAKLDIYTGGGSVHIGKLSINAGYFENSRDNNFTQFGNGPFGPMDLAGLGIISNSQIFNSATPGGFDRRKMYLAGLTYHASPVFTVAINGWWTKQTGYISDFNGFARQYQIITGYSLSRRSMLYAEADYAKYSGGLVGAQLVGVNGQSPTISSSQVGFMMGLRHYF
ncbi:porin [Burkholderia cepacia]|uniref:porin n=1 Tax=Burkholderia cepacia TaxID=292 RepID=UPI0009C0BA43|nr:porin [Burkholderia cepacia]